MPQDIVSGLFGLSPMQVQQQQDAAIESAANQYAQQDPFARASSSLYRAGAGLGRIGAGMLGMVNPQVQQAQQMSAAAQGVDTSTPEGLIEFAKKVQAYAPGKAAEAIAIAHKMKAENDAAAMATRKQDFQENEAMQLKRDQLAQQAELKKAQLEQAMEAAKLRSQDVRYSADQRREASSEATAMRGQIAQLMSEMKRLGIEAKIAASTVEKPMTPTQVAKQKQLSAKSVGALRAMDDDLSNMTSQAAAIANHPSLWRSTGALGVLPSMPGGGASEVDGLIDEFRASVKKTGLNMARQGGGIGSMTEREWPIVEGMVANIKPGAGGEVLKSQMDKVLAKIEQIRQNAYLTHNESFDDAREPKPLVTGKPTTPKPASPAQSQPANATPIYASNGQVRIMSTDGGKTWKPVGAK